MLNVAVIGCGYWGNHIIRNFNNSSDWNLKYICDTDSKQLAKLSSSYQDAEAVGSPEVIFDDKNVDAVVIATPVSTHFELAKSSLISGKHTWVEKPLTSSSEEAQELLKLARENGKLLHVDHTFIYTPAVRKIKELISSGQLGDILYFDSVRINLGLFQHDVNVIWDLAPHDLSILAYTIGKKPVSVSATGKPLLKYNEKDIASLAFLTINFEDGSIAHINVNWMSPVKIRQIIFGGSKKMLVFDDMETVSKIKIFDSGVDISSREDIYNALIQYRTGDMHSPAIKNFEALAFECTHFHDCIVNNRETDTDGESGLYVVQLLEAANRSLSEGGSPVYIEYI
ncbi:MAG: Gfo/Idh/MocA family oxidoreductase [Candidatus Kapabacteria bacterium]|nr:Gfo/Idh/MocA family oxidoreductase [Ignavibacteriota bacterium]MCW5884970.1 Gfo/Idh/MocA family oxidoreductase [Candidatus Kapabacteria bacterium]